jgi:hypothetical protein
MSNINNQFNAPVFGLSMTPELCHSCKQKPAIVMTWGMGSPVNKTAYCADCNPNSIEKMVERAVEAEREACAKIAEEFHWDMDSDPRIGIAKAIRRDE